MNEKGILGLLFDFGFTDFITKKLIRFLYMAGMAVVAFVALGFVVSGFSQGMAYGLLALVISPIFFLFLVAVVRIQLELVMVIFRIADHARAIADSTEAPAPPPIPRTEQP